MSRLIDADELMKTICGKECGQHFEECTLEDDNADTRCVFRDYVKSAPTVTAEPKRGRWIDWSMWGESKYQCTECNAEMKYKTNFCPRCGAKMDGGAENG